MASDTDMKTSLRRAWWRIVFGSCLILFVSFVVGFLHGRASGVRRSRHRHDHAKNLGLIVRSSEQVRRVEDRARQYARWVDFQPEGSEGHGSQNQMHEQDVIDAPNERNERERPQVALVSAYMSSAHDVIQELASDTKAKYAAMHGYAYFFQGTPSDGEFHSSTDRIANALLARWDEAEWLLWADSDVLFTNPDQDLQFLLDMAGGAPDAATEPPCVILAMNALRRRKAEDEGISPAVMLVRTSPQARDFLEDTLRTYKIDAARDSFDPAVVALLKVNPHVLLVEQQILDPYPDSKRLLKYEPRSSASLELSKGRALWDDTPACDTAAGGPDGKAGRCNLLVHLVCANGEIDKHCCNGMAAFYHHVFMERFALHAEGAPPFPPTASGAAAPAIPRWATGCF
ncbi:hypothetical protein FVE85_8487 [Porphyridium purpureum]|uniref:Uncharacterized protein n=1 Tax=Porphyridium purpureum TaxID=35688 RepID=A0A5J4YLI5_PORPP|nr:hypothetical protein FVE85_8487 [Porphyridium purpureum]|eukprot:POR8151..scf244_11